MSKLYVPSYDNNSCVHIENDYTIRVYESIPTANTNVNYTDYYFKSNYISNTGMVNFATSVPSSFCLDTSNLTTDFYYRYDLDKILIIFLILFLFIIFLPYKIISRCFGRWLKV